MTRLDQPRVAARVLQQDADFCLARWQRTLFAVFRGPASVNHVKAISMHCLALLDERGGDATYVSIIERASPAPSDEVRRVLAVWSRDVVSKMACAAIVAEGGGFKNAMVRGVGVALTVLAPHRVPFKFTATAEEACEQLAKFLPAAGGGPQALALAIADVRQRWKAAL